MKNCECTESFSILRTISPLSAWIEVGGVVDWHHGELRQRGPSLIVLSGECVAAVIDCEELPAAWRDHMRITFSEAMGIALPSAVAAPGLIEGHAHLFLTPATNLSGTEDEIRERALNNAESALRQGILWLRDCGDPFSVNLWVRETLKASHDAAPQIRACGPAIHRVKRYGKQLGRAVTDDAELLQAAKQRIKDGADDIKVILSGIVNFQTAEVPGEPQFPVKAMSEVVKLAWDHGKRVIVHASGPAAVNVAAKAGVHTIEHAYFASDDSLKLMAEKQIVWLPTLAPVHVQWRDAERYGHTPETRATLRKILDGHEQRIRRGRELGVPIACGSDSGSPGIGHGDGAVLEFKLLNEAGLSKADAYAASSAPGARWLGFNDALGAIDRGSAADFALLPRSPLNGVAAFQSPLAIVRRGKFSACDMPARCHA